MTRNKPDQPDDQKPEPVNSELAGNQKLIDAKKLAVATKMVETAAAIEKEIEGELLKTGVKMALEGYLLLKAKQKVQGKKDDEDRDSVFNGLLAKYKLKPRTAARRIQLAQALLDGDVIDTKTALAMEEAETVTPALFELIETRVGSDTGTALMRDMGILPQLEDKPIKKAKTAKEKIEAKADQMKVLVKEMHDLIESDEVREQVPDTNILKGYYKLMQDVDETIAQIKKIDWLVQTPVPVLVS
jgi:hypothetical protein